MPGRNCCLPLCTVSESKKHEGIKLFQISTRKDEFYTEWREGILAVVYRFREPDPVFKARVKNGRAFICERHYSASDMELTSKYM